LDIFEQILVNCLHHYHYIVVVWGNSLISSSSLTRATWVAVCHSAPRSTYELWSKLHELAQAKFLRSLEYMLLLRSSEQSKNRTGNSTRNSLASAVLWSSLHSAHRSVLSLVQKVRPW